jgi:hypothetical protein
MHANNANCKHTINNSNVSFAQFMTRLYTKLSTLVTDLCFNKPCLQCFFISEYEKNAI